MELLFDESLSPKLVLLLRDLFPESESALRNGLAGPGDRAFGPKPRPTISSWSRWVAISNAWWSQIPDAKVVILRSCDYATDVAADMLRRNAIRIAAFASSPGHLIVLDE